MRLRIWSTLIEIIERSLHGIETKATYELKAVSVRCNKSLYGLSTEGHFVTFINESDKNGNDTWSKYEDAIKTERISWHIIKQQPVYGWTYICI